MEYIHYSVMPDVALEYLKPVSDSPIMVDNTLGEGGHSRLFLEKYPNLRVIGLDRDKNILEKARTRLEPYKDRFEGKNLWFNEFWSTYDGEKVDMILFDLGISVFHYEESKRGFSFKKEEDLDMRLDINGPLSAKDIVNGYDEVSLANVIFNYGEERYSRRIASAICKERELHSIEKTNHLADIIWNAVPNDYRHRRIHPATKTFQALRIETNGELDRIEPALEGAIKALKPGGRIGVITFHSLEDRPVKWFFKNHMDVLEILTKKPIEPSEEECKLNPPSRSAKFRFAEKLTAQRALDAGKKNKYRNIGD
ncbi:MAG: 16S rRNA (cytosine(1402)-N(4))-methyltransferase RsmH [Sphaerochaetaceae bacterium]|nr:16S rRNA (cytosine(1402)-N(4))-methyltransferase RsmH [Sphaerochaetaceae bacterium]